MDLIGVDIFVNGCPEGINIGDFVWYDWNKDGLQQPTEQGVPDFQVLLYAPGPDEQIGTSDDELVDLTFTDTYGFYLFECVPEGIYQIVFPIKGVPDNYVFTLPNQGSNDLIDSDADTLTGATEPFEVIAGQEDNFSFDAGLNIVCIPLDGGSFIGFEQTVCAGIPVDPLESIWEPGQGLAPVEYLWMSTTLPGIPFNPGTWEIIPGATEADYDPGQLYQTTTFIRCARYEGCEKYTGESNMVTIIVVPYDPDECPPAPGNNLIAPQQGSFKHHFSTFDAEILPNPTDGRIQVVLKNIAENGKYQFSLFNQLGERVMVLDLGNDNTNRSIDLDHLTKGMYYYIVEDEQGVEKVEGKVVLK